MKVSRGTIVDASIINAPSSTKNKKKERDPQMRQTHKGHQCYFGMKAHLGGRQSHKAHSLRGSLQQLMSTTLRFCPICSMGKKHASGEILRTAVRDKPSLIALPAPKTSPRRKAAAIGG